MAVEAAAPGYVRRTKLPWPVLPRGMAPSASPIYPGVDYELLNPGPGINRVDSERVFRLWDELAAFPSAEIDLAWRHLANTIAG